MKKERRLGMEKVIQFANEKLEELSKNFNFFYAQALTHPCICDSIKSLRQRK